MPVDTASSTPPKPITVMNQKALAGDDGHNTCGIHSLKNMLLYLSMEKGTITRAEFEKHVQDQDVFKSFLADLKAKNLPFEDVLPEQFIKLAEQAEEGFLELDLGDRKINFKNLNLKRMGNQDFTVLSFSNAPNELEYGLTAMDEDLLNAAAAAKFVRSKGKCTHVFSVGAAKTGIIGHYITAVVKKDEHGQRTWEFMDSWYNDTTFSPNLIRKIERVLSKKKEELPSYLLGVYKVSNDRLNNLYNAYFDNTGAENPLVFPNGKAHFLDKSLPCGFSRMDKNPTQCTIDEIEKALGSQSKGINSFVIFNNLTYYVDQDARKVKQINLPGLNQDKKNFVSLFTNSYQLADNTQLDVIKLAVIPNAKRHFVDDQKNRETYQKKIEECFSFMQTAEWLTAPGAELTHISQLYNLANYILINTLDPVTQAKLGPICTKLKDCLSGVREEKGAADAKDEGYIIEEKTHLTEAGISGASAGEAMTNPVAINNTDATIQLEAKEDKASSVATTPHSSDTLKIQAAAALDAVQNGTPAHTEGFLNSLVNAIRYVWGAIRDAIVNVFTSVTARS